MLERVISALDAAADVFRRRTSGLRLRHVSAPPAAGAPSNRSQCAPVLLDVLYVVMSLAIFILLIATLGALGAGVGLDVAPIGEDYNWLYLLQRGSGADTARLFWAADGRNPLSPWWYIAARKIIFEFDAGLLMLRYMMAAVLALSLYCMVVTVAGRQSRLFAISLAILTVFWMANRYTDQVIWNFHGALFASLISVAAYAQFIESGRRAYFLYAGVDCRVVPRVRDLHPSMRCSPGDRLSRTATNSGWQFWKPLACGQRIGLAMTDTAPYLALFVFFLLLWRMTIDPNILTLLSPSSFHNRRAFDLTSRGDMD